MATSTKKKSSDSERPKRPLSAYNLFYRYKRAKIIEFKATAISGKNGGISKDDVYGLLARPPGIELHHPTGQIPSDSLNEIRRSNIRKSMAQQLEAKSNTKRSHRKSTALGFKTSFGEMNKMMLDSWKGTDELSKGIFQELAEEGRQEYAVKMKKYKDEKKHLTGGGSNKSSTDNDKKPKFKNPNRRITAEDIKEVATKEATTAGMITDDMITEEQLQLTREVSSDSTAAFELLSPTESCEFDWEPLPFQTEQLTTASQPTPPLDMSFMMEVEPPPFVAPVAVTPIASVKQLLSFDDFPSLPFYHPGISPSPILVGTKDCNKNTESILTPKHQVSVSVDDFQQFLATLEKIEP